MIAALLPRANRREHRCFVLRHIGKFTTDPNFHGVPLGLDYSLLVTACDSSVTPWLQLYPVIYSVKPLPAASLLLALTLALTLAPRTLALTLALTLPLTGTGAETLLQLALHQPLRLGRIFKVGAPGRVGYFGERLEEVLQARVFAFDDLLGSAHIGQLCVEPARLPERFQRHPRILRVDTLEALRKPFDAVTQTSRKTGV